MHFGPLYENYMKNAQKNGTFVSPEIYEKVGFLTDIYFFHKIWPFPEDKAITYFDLSQF